MTCARTFAAVLFVIWKNQKQPRCPSTPERIIPCWHMTTGYTWHNKEGSPVTGIPQTWCWVSRTGLQGHRMGLHLHKVREWIQWFSGDSRTVLSLGERECLGRRRCSRWMEATKLYWNLPNCMPEVCAFCGLYLSEETKPKPRLLTLNVAINLGTGVYG